MSLSKFERAQAAASDEISNFNLKQNLPSDVKEFYFRSTMDKLQQSEERLAMLEAQQLLDARRNALQDLTKVCLRFIRNKFENGLRVYPT